MTIAPACAIASGAQVFKPSWIALRRAAVLLFQVYDLRFIGEPLGCVIQGLRLPAEFIAATGQCAEFILLLQRWLAQHVLARRELPQRVQIDLDVCFDPGPTIMLISMYQHLGRCPSRGRIRTAAADVTGEELTRVCGYAPQPH